MAQYLANNFVVWAWDLTRPDLHARFVTIVTRVLDSLYANQVRSLQSEDLPVLLLVHRSSGSAVEMLSQITPQCTADEALSQLLQARDMFDSCNQELISAERQRETREAERSELKRAYMESLTQDQQKEELRRQEEAARRQAEELAAHEEAARVAEGVRDMQAAAQELPPEPAPPTNPEERSQVTTLRLRPPGAAAVIRRFRADERLRHLLAFCVTLGYPPTKYKLITTFPRREVLR